MKAARKISNMDGRPLFSAGVESDFTLETRDGFTLYGIRNAVVAKPAEKLFVIAHGVTGFPTEYLHQMAARYFVGKGYDVVRFCFYTDQPDARKMKNCTLEDQVADLRLVIEKMRPGYGKVFVAGHSYGGMTAMLANPDVDAISMWDSTLWSYKEFWERETRPDTSYGCRAFDYGFSVPVGEKMFAEGVSYTPDRTMPLARAMKSPVQVMAAGEDVRRRGQEEIFSVLPSPKDFAVIEGAGHEFTEGDTVFDLLDRTYEWFERF